MSDEIDDSAKIIDSNVGQSMVREFVTVHDSTIGDDCEIYERSSVKKCRIGDDVVINAGNYIENVEIGDEVQIGPNSSIVGVTHNLDESGMELHNDVFARVILRTGAFVGAGAVVVPGVEIGRDTVVSAGAVVTEDLGERKLVIGSPPTQQVIDLSDWV
ncbi:acyltransferase [Halococcus saccharolyticus]|uniref:Acyltransferase n=1 Tax=Halococcus saccharolyticus DSM 5350 TaxID=1227455 RepID=M0MME7_9EURY|nr:DapH/DapD/GlmU-related protein [Halococcus saccharolyticus]EMA46518.1 hypothetical protein C449_04195 [Halococcus saccharolyticus DSM 5350]